MMMAEESIPASTSGVSLKETGATNGGLNEPVNDGGTVNEPGMKQEDSGDNSVSYEMYKSVLEERDQLSLTLNEIKQQVNHVHDH